MVAVHPSPPGPVTATGTEPRNVCGQALAITVFSTVKWWGRVFLPLVFLYARLNPKSRGTLGKLSFIHFARWTLVREIPYNGAPQQEGRLKLPRLYFESNFNGGWEEYIDAFSHILTSGMKTFWGSSYGFPQPLPTAPFKRYIKDHEVEAAHFYSAYPEATTTMITGALKLEEELAAFRERTGGLDADAFAAEWRALLTRTQRWL